MTNIDFLTNSNGKLVGFTAYGHSENAVKGNDIVCSAISSALYLVANTVTEVIKVNAEITVKDADMKLLLDEKDSYLCQDVLQGLKLHLLLLEEQYPNNISVNYMEV